MCSKQASVAEKVVVAKAEAEAEADAMNRRSLEAAARQ